MSATPEEILEFWFEELGPKDWFIQSDAVDAEITKRFGDVWEEAWRSGRPLGWRRSVTGRMAHLILTDQFPRNMFRGDRRSFATDRIALGTALGIVARGEDRQLPPEQRSFVYLPFQHSESLQFQERGVALTRMRLADDGNTLRHARAHRDIIRRYGRFPHRNAVMGRDSTLAEEAYLQAGGYGAVVNALHEG